VLEVSSQAELDQLYAVIGRWERAPIRVIELAVHVVRLRLKASRARYRRLLTRCSLLCAAQP
jgi:hypothetical protein